MIKKKTAITAILLSVSLIGGCAVKNSDSETDKAADAARLLTEAKTTQYFTADDVPEEDVEKILAAGINAPSAMNTQPWHFTAITNSETTQKLADAMSAAKPPAKPVETNANTSQNSGKPNTNFSKAANKAGIGDAPLTIVISCEEGAELSAGLAVQNMSAEALLLGYGTKILTSPTIALNGENSAEYAELLQIPENQKVAAVLLVGKAESEKDNPDVISSATSRNPIDDVTLVIR